MNLVEGAVMYNGSDESKFQTLRKEREQRVRLLRVALEKAGLREYGASGLLGGAIDQRMLQPSATQRNFDIETVIANAAEIRTALASFDTSIPQPADYSGN